MHAQMRKGVVSLGSKQPFHNSARTYFDKGWLPMPLPPKKKSKPPTGYTGWDATKVITQKAIDKWLSEVNPSSNIALRPARNHMGIDVDAYKDAGDDTYEKIIAEIGGLPDTWISSARDDGKSGIRHYRLPEGTEKLQWPGKIGGGIETVHYGHRYVVAPPSIHPEKDALGNVQNYAWYAPGEVPAGVNYSHDIPAFDDLTEMPMALVEYLTKGRFQKHLPAKNLGSVSESKKKVSAWIAERSDDACARMIEVTEGIIREFEGASAHDTARDGLYRIACLSAEGHPGLAEAIGNLHDAFIAEVSNERRDGTARGMAQAEEEWLRFRDGAVKKILQREDDGDFIGAACTCTGFTPEGKPKERIDVSNYYLPEALSICYDAVRARAETEWKGMYQMSGALQELNASGLHDVSRATLRSAVARRVDWMQWKGGEEPKPVPALPPRDFLESMLEDHSIPQELPEIRGLSKTPFWALVDDVPTLISDNGYHKGAKIFMDMDPKLQESVEKMDLEPNAKWVKKAIEIIERYIGSFPYVGDADRAVIYAALCLPFMRDLIAGPTPLHLIEAPTPGTGKSLLGDVVAMVACGRLDGEDGYQQIGAPKGKNRNEELEKEIVTRMKARPRVLIIDNVSHTLDSPRLASGVASYPMYQARGLGANITIEVPNRTLWLATANNLSASEEIATRVVPCRIDAGVERPRERGGFRDLYEDVPAARPALVWAVLTLIAHWVANDRPTADLKMGTFDHWAKNMGGLLDCIGIEGLLSNQKRFLERSKDDGVRLDGLVIQWSNTLQDRVTVQQILDSCDATEDLIPSDGRDRARRLGRLLSDAEDQFVAGFFVRKTTLNGRAVYYLEKQGDVGQSFGRRRRAKGVTRGRSSGL